MEWEQSSEDTESDEDEWEEYLLDMNRDIVKSCNGIDIHCGSTTEVVDTKNTNDKQSRTTHEHEGKFHC